MKSKLVILLLFLISGCGIQINNALLDTSGNNNNNISGGSDVATDSTIDQVDDDNSITGFGGGTHLGTIYQNNTLTIDSSSAVKRELDSSWTPQYSNINAYWKFNNNYNDSVGTNNASVIGGSPSFNTSSRLGSHALEVVSSNNDNIEAYSGSNFGQALRDESISAWFKPTGNGSGLTTSVFRLGTNLNAQLELGTNTGAQREAKCATYFDTGNIQLFTPINHNEWYFAVCTLEHNGGTSTLKMFLNGTLVAEGSRSASNYQYNTGIYRFGAQKIVSGRYFKGLIDEAVHWNVTLTKAEVKEIYFNQLAEYGGEFTSRIMDTQDSNSAWTNIDWLTSLPFGKELPSINGSESSDDYSELIGSNNLTTDNDLLTNIVTLWNFNESSLNSAPSGNDFENSIEDAYHLRESGGVSSGETCLFNNCIKLDGVDDYVDISYNVNTNPTVFTVSTWINISALSGSTHSIFSTLAGGTTYRGTNLQVSSSGVVTARIGNGSSWDYASGGTIKESTWHHIVYSYDGTTFKIYIDGVLIDTDTSSYLPNNVSSREFCIGAGLSTCSTSFFNGYIDEFALWARALNDNEILQLYRRGANRIKFQVRTCASADCSDQNASTGDGWKGPGGNYLTYFSELYNNSNVTATCTTAQECDSSELSLQGNVLTISPSINFSDFTTDGLLGVDNNRYFQYRVIMESDDFNTTCDSGTTTCMPELNSVIIGPGHSYEE